MEKPGAGRLSRVGNAGTHSGKAAFHGGRLGRHGAPRLSSGARTLPARTVLDDVRTAAVDGSPVRRFLDRGGIQRVLQTQSRGGAEGTLDRVRSRDAPRLRQ